MVVDVVGDDSDVDFDITSAGFVEDDNDNDVAYFFGGQGTYAVTDNDEYTYVRVYSSPVASQYAAFIVSEDAEVSSSAAPAGSVMTQRVNPIAVGVAISDEDAMSLIGKENLIVVGGPVVNTVMAKLKNNPTSEEIAAEYKMGVGLVELYDKTNFEGLGTKLALLVSGYEWQDTQRAARAVAQHSDANFKGNAIEVHGTSTTISEIKAVQE